MYVVVVLTILNVPANGAEKGSAICTELRNVLDKQRPKNPEILSIDSRFPGGGDTEYLDLDIDGDGIADNVLQSCGSRDMPCSLFITLSGGKKLELLDEDRFFLGKYKSKIYVIVGDSLSVEPRVKRNKRKIYEVTATQIKLVCSKV